MLTKMTGFAIKMFENVKANINNIVYTALRHFPTFFLESFSASISEFRGTRLFNLLPDDKF